MSPMPSKFILITLLAAMPPAMGIEPRQTTADTTSPTPPRPTISGPPISTSLPASGSLSSCSSAASDLYNDYPKGPTEVVKASETFYETVSRTAKSPTPDCQFFTSLPTASLVDPVVQWIKDLDSWSHRVNQQNQLWYLIDHCSEQLPEEETPELCRSEATSWLKKARVSEEDLKNRLEGNASRLAQSTGLWIAIWELLTILAVL